MTGPRAKPEAPSLFPCLPLPDLMASPVVGSPMREAHELTVLERASDLLREQDGSIRDALYELEHQLRGPYGRATVSILEATRTYARELVSYVEQCWATAVLR